jgi:GABA permease
MKGDRTEFAAIPIVAGILGILFTIFIASVYGVGSWLALGVAFLVVAAVVVYGLTRWRRNAPPPDAPVTGTADVEDGIYRVLVVAHDSCSSDALGTQVAGRAAGRPAEVLVVAPVAGSRLSRWTGDEADYAGAQTRLDVTLAALNGFGVEARGRIGARDPLQAADDGLREFAANEVVFASAPVTDADWLASGVVERARDRYGVPVTHVVVESTV